MYNTILCYMAANTREQRGRKKAINSNRLESTVILGIEQYERRKMVEERTVIVRP